MTEKNKSLLLQPIDIVPFLTIENARDTFSPELQNVMAALLAAIKPISISLLTRFSTNLDGKKFGNSVEVNEKDTQLLIAVLQEAEKRFNVSLLETREIQKNEDLRNSKSALVSTNTATNLETRYRLVPEIQEFTRTNYPELFTDANSMLSDTLWDDLFGDEDTAANTELNSSVNLLPDGSKLSGLVDSAAKAVTIKN